MKKVDIEKIYPQEEKDREGEKLKKLCDMHEGQKSLHADGRELINTFVKPMKMVKHSAELFKQKLAMSHIKSPDQSRFLRRIDR